MEWCVHIAGAADLQGAPSLERFASIEQSPKLRPAMRRAAELIGEHFGTVTFTRCAFGAEFCEHLLPPASALESASCAARRRGLAFTLLTPYVGNQGLEKLRVLFRVAEALGPTEVVFNDWGVLNVLRNEFPSLIPVQGRLLHKSLRDPRVMGIYAESPAANGSAASTLAALQGSNFDNPSYSGLLERFGVRGVELDYLPQGTCLASAGMPVSVYLPAGFVSTSRACMAAGLHYRKPDKFQPGAPCRHECQTHLLEYTYTNSPFGNRDQRFYLKGNTYFYLHTEAALRSLLEQASAGRIARLVFQPRLPMLAS